MAKNKVYKVVAKYEFEMVGQKKEQVVFDLGVLLDSLVECHSNMHTGNDADFPENFTGKYPKRISCVATLSKATRQLNPKKYKD